MKIMSNTLFVGIDISSQTIAVYFMDQTGKGPKSSIELNNDLMDATLLVEHILTYADTIKADSVKIGMESTSDYALHLHHFLASVPDLEPLSPQIYVLNPAIVNGFKKTLTFRQKTDDLDAKLIADCVRFGRVEPTKIPDPRYPALQRLTRYRFQLVQSLTNEKNRALHLVYLKFSSYRSDKLFSDTFGKASTSILESFSVEEISAMPMEDLVKFICENGNNRLKDPEAIASKLQVLARRAYRLNPDISDSIELTLSMSLENIRFMESQVTRIDKEIARQLRAFRQTLDTIPGIGPTLSACIVSEIGDISRFHNDAALAKFAGLVWTRYQSGSFDAQNTSLAKCGNAYLRYYLVEAANSLRVHNEEFKAFYQKKYNEVTKHQHKRALVLTARKFVRLVYAMLSKGQIYNGGGAGLK